ncbi:MAG: hypothetical protein HYY06_07190 [Deltaproteobacteria bacterium]|nr:hypothetical protein [Deltaproteobacteria bacterium]
MRRLTILSLFLAACGNGDAPEGLYPTPAGSGPRVVFDLFAKPLPVIPLPNDAATWADPDSPTGRRINASKVAPTEMEQRARALFDTMDGWGTYSTISIPFDAKLDLLAFLDTFRDAANRADYDPADDAVYVIDLETGLPVAIDTGEGNFPIALDDPWRYYPNDTRGGQSNILFETVDEGLQGQGDSDFDGALDHANLLDLDGDGLGVDEVDQVDDLVTFYEMETNTLLVRPIIPLRERHEYAVVVTRRLLGENGEPARSPFAYTSHVEQARSLEPLAGILADRPELYGGLEIQDVAFAWTFTTQSVTADLVAINKGLRGEGPFASLASFPTSIDVPEVFGVETSFCTLDIPPNTHVVPGETFVSVAESIARDVFDVNDEDLEPLLSSFDYISYLTIGFYPTPYLLEGEPACLTTSCDPELDVTCPSYGTKELCKPWDDVDAEWNVNSRTGQIRVGEDVVPIWISVPKERPEAGIVQPFPVAFYGHGYTSSPLESVGFAGAMARWGVASIGVAAAGHGLGLDAATEMVARGIFDINCLAPLGESALTDRARDLDNDGQDESGGDFWTGYVFHTRDMVRQSVVDYQQLIRIMQSWDGRTVGSQDFDNDGQIELAGDFDANGVPDLGGPDNGYYAWGQSLGGILSMIVGAADPAVRAAAPTAGSAGLTDVGIRSRQGGVKEAVVLRIMGPLILGATVDEGEDGDPVINVRDSAEDKTLCQAGQTSLWLVVPDLNDTGIVEFACSDSFSPGDVIVAQNLVNDEVRCATAGQDPNLEGDTRFRIGLPSDIDDHFEVAVYDRASLPDGFVFGDECAVPTGLAPKERLTDFTVPEATFQGRRWLAGDPLSMPAEGLGLRRQTPSLRRFLMLAQAALDPGDPANYARHYFVDPLDFGSRGAPAHNLLDVPTIGDMNVPVNTGIAFARIAGILPFIPSASALASVYPEYAATPEVEATYGGRTPNQVLLDNYVIEGLSRLNRFEGHDPEDPGILFDPDDLDDSLDEWNAPDLGDQGLPPLRAHLPTPGTTNGTSGLAMPYVSNHGDHGFELPEPTAAFDINTYMANLLGLYFSSGGERLLYVEDPAGHKCLEDSSCDFIVEP